MSLREPTKPLAVIEGDYGLVQYEQPALPPSATYQYRPLPSETQFRLLTLEPGQFDDKLKCSIGIYELGASGTPPFSAVSYTWLESECDRLFADGDRVPQDSPLRSDYSVRHTLWCVANLNPRATISDAPVFTWRRDPDDQQQRQRLLVSTNLRDLLRRVRHRSESTILWIDALCINQEDYDERASQIVLMQQIYRNAEQGCLWLGEEHEKSSSALELLQQLVKAQELVESGLLAAPTPGDLYDANTTTSYDLPAYLPDAETRWTHLTRLLGRPFFSRLWILQELVAAAKVVVYCGEVEPMEWNATMFGFSFLINSGWIRPMLRQERQSTPNSNIVGMISSIRLQWQAKSTSHVRRIRLYRLLDIIRLLETTDPRDKIYAIIGLVDGHEVCEPSLKYGIVDVPGQNRQPHQRWAWSTTGQTKPDYRRTTVEVYTEFTIKCIQDCQSLEVLALVEDRSKRQIQSLPSWVPDFTADPLRAKVQRMDEHSKTAHFAAGTTKPRIRWSHSTPGTITLRAFIFSSISHVEVGEIQPHLFRIRAARWTEILATLPSVYPTGEAKIDAFWRTLIGDCIIVDKKLIKPASPCYKSFYGSFMERAMLDPNEAQKRLDSGMWTMQVMQRIVSESDWFQLRYSELMSQRRFAVSGKGYFCAVPESAEVGDSLAVLEGGGVPFVLRRTAEDDMFEVVGECYVHGLMDGQVLEWEGFEWKEITLV